MQSQENFMILNLDTGNRIFTTLKKKMSNMPIRMHGLDQNPIFNPGLPKDQKPVLFHLQDF